MLFVPCIPQTKQVARKMMLKGSFLTGSSLCRKDDPCVAAGELERNSGGLGGSWGSKKLRTVEAIAIRLEAIA